MEPSDKQLLERFVAHQDEQAFEAIVQHYSSMIMGVCQRVIGNSHDAEDAFQATFLVLAEKASKLHTDQPIGNWLYRVAVQKAMNIKSKAYKKYEEPAGMEETVTTETNPNEAWTQLRPVLDEELACLPDKLRWPILLCYLQGRTYEDAAN